MCVCIFLLARSPKFDVKCDVSFGERSGENCSLFYFLLTRLLSLLFLFVFIFLFVLPFKRFLRLPGQSKSKSKAKKNKRTLKSKKDKGEQKVFCNKTVIKVRYTLKHIAKVPFSSTGKR